MGNLHAGDLVEASTEGVEMLSALFPQPPSACVLGHVGLRTYHLDRSDGRPASKAWWIDLRAVSPVASILDSMTSWMSH